MTAYTKFSQSQIIKIKSLPDMMGKSLHSMSIHLTQNFNKKKIQLKVEIFLEQREVAFLSFRKICENLIFSTVHL